MLSLEDALGRVLSSVTQPGTETVPLTESLHRIAVEDVLAPLALPGFDNSAMDGYAVLAADTLEASETTRVSLNCLGEVPAGSVFQGVVGRGECVRVFTGSPIPSGADAVIMQEDTCPSADHQAVEILDAVKPWENVRLKGEDIKVGARIVERGHRVRVGHLALAAACGLNTISVGRRPVVGLLATGSELVEPGEPLSPGCIHESNRLTLAVLTEKAGGTPRVFPIVADDLDQTCEAFDIACEQCDILITTGAVSVGTHDYVKPAVRRMGGTMDFWQVAIRPGKPFVMGSVKGTPWFGLPGNPISAFVTFLLLARPAILKAQGAVDLRMPTLRGVLGEPFANGGWRRHFARVRIENGSSVTSAGLQASHALSSLACADGLLELPPGCEWEAGREVDVLLIDD